MGYIFIFLSVFSNALKGYCTKQLSKKTETTGDAIRLNKVRMVICCLYAMLFVLLKQEGNILNISVKEFWICLISGIAQAVFAICWMLAIKTDAYMLVSSSASASFVVPCVFGLFLLNEHFTLLKFLSFIVIIIALYFMLRHNFSVKGKLTKIQILLLGLVLLSQGLNQSMQKLYAYCIINKDGSYYTLYSFIFATVLLFISERLFKKSPNTGNQQFIRTNMKFILIAAFGLFATTYFQTLAAKSVDAIILYPMVNALSLIAGTTMASLFFKEKISKDCIIGIIFVFAALILSRI